MLLSLATPDEKLNYKKIESFKTRIDVSSKISWSVFESKDEGNFKCNARGYIKPISSFVVNAE
jgi:hypothetical protein